MKCSIAWLVLLLGTLCFVRGEVANGEKRGKREGGKKARVNPQKIALEKWASSLTPRDYNYTEWRIAYHSRSTVDFFNGYARKLSDLFKECNAKVNFAMIGACDGTGDNTIKNLYLPNEHWRGVFVEPLTMNVRDLIKYLADKHANQRSTVIHAAATAECVKPTLVMERPMYEEKNASIPHWLRRQIGSLLPDGRDHPRNEWTTEEVRCVTATDILTDWSGRGRKGGVIEGPPGADAVNEEVGAVFGGGKNKGKRRRPHVLKIDVEGHDYEVLMGFLRLDTPVDELPLLIDFEAKSIAKKFPMAQERMEQLGYVVSPFGQDGFALLKADKILESLGGTKGGGGGSGAGKKAGRKQMLRNSVE